ncbi:uncharacterized protein LOC128551418 [Mercenaria mercenaria]|uniref:uncharacterized protein LOC128551418 n=1 Tax=Mercenaria mercenaria TaxID=6596 RepID=UPI00234F461F|nr:uncharacterized protein LOC128551418 [Mercenaria mercenaria]
MYYGQHMIFQSPESRQKYKETFSIDPVTGSVSLNQCLDYESNSYYQFIVTAKDSGPNGGLSSTAEFTIHVKDVQDEPPFFTGIYRKPIKANTPKGSEAARVHAIDGDQGVSNEIHYSITYSSCGDGLFIINSATGVIYTSRNIDRNSGTIRQQFGYCTVTVEASEIQKVNETQYGNTTASTNVTITLQDFNAHQPTTTDVTGIAASTLQPTKQTLPSLNCTEPWNFQSPCNESTVQAGVTKFPHPASHHKFLICDASGKTYSAYCPPNEVFHAGCSSCAPPLQRFSASCQLFKDDFTNPCSKENVIAGNLTFPYPNSSTKYIRCDTLGNAWVEECLSGSLWDQANLVCMLPAAYNPCHRRGSMVQSLFPHYCNPRLYVQCGNNQQPFVHTCQKNYVFLQWDLTCIPPGFPGSEHLRYTCN